VEDDAHFTQNEPWVTETFCGRWLLGATSNSASAPQHAPCEEASRWRAGVVSSRPLIARAVEGPLHPVHARTPVRDGEGEAHLMGAHRYLAAPIVVEVRTRLDMGVVLLCSCRAARLSRYLGWPSLAQGASCRNTLYRFTILTPPLCRCFKPPISRMSALLDMTSSFACLWSRPFEPATAAGLRDTLWKLPTQSVPPSQ
jgi:hypothetical protein